MAEYIPNKQRQIPAQKTAPPSAPLPGGTGQSAPSSGDLAGRVLADGPRPGGPSLSQWVLWVSIALTAVCGIGLIVRTIGTIPALMSFFFKAGLAAGALTVVCMWSFRRWKGAPFADRIAANGLLLSATILATLVVSEMALRFIFRDVTTTADNASYFARKWNAAHVTLNASGFRGPEFQVPKPPGTYRIAVIGDSFTYGQGIAEEERFARVLERRLNDGVGKFEVLTFGRPGSESDQHVSYLEDNVLPADPDYVLLQWYVNDYQVKGRKNRVRIPLLWPHWTASILKSQSALYYILDRQWSSLHYASAEHRRLEEIRAIQPYGDSASEENRSYVALLQRFLDICQRAQVPAAVVLFPQRYETAPQPYPYAPLHDLVSGTFEKAGMPAVDLRPSFAPYEGDYEALSVNIFDGHPNALANRLAAEAILRALESRWRQAGYKAAKDEPSAKR